MPTPAELRAWEQASANIKPGGSIAGMPVDDAVRRYQFLLDRLKGIKAQAAARGGGLSAQDDREVSSITAELESMVQQYPQITQRAQPSEREQAFVGMMTGKYQPTYPGIGQALKAGGERITDWLRGLTGTGTPTASTPMPSLSEMFTPNQPYVPQIPPPQPWQQAGQWAGEQAGRIGATLSGNVPSQATTPFPSASDLFATGPAAAGQYQEAAPVEPPLLPSLMHGSGGQIAAQGEPAPVGPKEYTWEDYMAEQAAQEQAARDWQMQLLQYEYGQRMAMQQQELDRQMQIEQMRQAMQKQQMAAEIGQTVAAQQQAAWSRALPVMYNSNIGQSIPGTQLGGPLEAMGKIGRFGTQPMQAVAAPYPSADEMMSWIAQAMGRFGG